LQGEEVLDYLVMGVAVLCLVTQTSLVLTLMWETVALGQAQLLQMAVLLELSQFRLALLVAYKFFGWNKNENSTN
jgi:hypothetical protein